MEYVTDVAVLKPLPSTKYDITGVTTFNSSNNLDKLTGSILTTIYPTVVSTTKHCQSNVLVVSLLFLLSNAVGSIFPGSTSVSLLRLQWRIPFVVASV
jgi:hypothetical protein